MIPDVVRIIAATAVVVTEDFDNNNNNNTSNCEICGWMAAICSALAFGTFAVPIKSDIARSVNIDPLVFQSYKTIMCFITAWCILFVPNHHTFIFTPWGIVSGLFWVPSGIATIYAVKTIGLALGIGIASSLIVLVSFIWGIFIFKEPIHSQFGACIAILCMILGLFGMSYYSTPTTPLTETIALVVPTTTTGGSIRTTAAYEEVGTTIDDDDDDDDDEVMDESVDHIPVHLPYRDDTSNGLGKSMPQHVIQHQSTMNHHDGLSHRSIDDERVLSDDTTIEAVDFDNENLQIHPQHQRIVVHDHELITHVHILGQYKISKRYLGMASAAFCGLYGGSVMAPMKYSTANAKGTHYLLSFAIGSAIVNVALWIFRYLYYVFHYKSWTVAYNQLPSFHLRKMWLVGSTSGIIWSIGNFFSLISVFYLGEGVGYPLVQTSILISGLWGLFYFKEIQGTDRIAKWLLSSVMTVCGILLLSFEHHTK